MHTRAAAWIGLNGSGNSGVSIRYGGVSSYESNVDVSLTASAIMSSNDSFEVYVYHTAGINLLDFINPSQLGGSKIQITVLKKISLQEDLSQK